MPRPPTRHTEIRLDSIHYQVHERFAEQFLGGLPPEHTHTDSYLNLLSKLDAATNGRLIAGIPGISARYNFVATDRELRGAMLAHGVPVPDHTVDSGNISAALDKFVDDILDSPKPRTSADRASTRGRGIART